MGTRRYAGFSPVFRAGLPLLASAMVVAWRALAYNRPSSLIPIAPGFEAALAAVGLFYVVAGLAAYHLRPGPPGGLFLVSCLGAGVHWGGTIGAASQAAELSWLLLYLALSLLGEAALVHVALRFPRTWSTSKAIPALLYAPAVAAGALVPVAGGLPIDVLRPSAGILLVAGHVLGVLAGAIFIVRFWRADRETRRRARLGLVVTSFVLAGVPSMLGSLGLLPGPTDGLNLLSILVPAGLGYALVVVRRG